MKPILITNPLWLGNIAPRVKEFVDKTAEYGITYESRYSQFVHSIQFGGENSEFWVVMDGDDPVAFGHWSVIGLPFVGTVLFDALYKWSNHKDPVRMLIEKFVLFGKKHRCTGYRYEAVNEKVASLIENHSKDLGYTTQRSPSVRVFIKAR